MDSTSRFTALGAQKGFHTIIGLALLRLDKLNFEMFFPGIDILGGDETKKLFWKTSNLIKRLVCRKQKLSLRLVVDEQFSN